MTEGGLRRRTVLRIADAGDHAEHDGVRAAADREALHGATALVGAAAGDAAQRRTMDGSNSAEGADLTVRAVADPAWMRTQHEGGG